MKRLWFARLAAPLFLSILPLSVVAQVGDLKEAKINEEQARILLKAAAALEQRMAAVDPRLRSMMEGAGTATSTASEYEKRVPAANAGNSRLNGLYFQVSKKQLEAHLFYIRGDIKQLEAELLEALSDDNQRAAAKYFFEDLMWHYEEASKALETSTSEVYDQARYRIYGLFYYQRDAYRKIASEHSYTFNLEIRSDPQDGVIWLKRMADPYKRYANRTNAVVSNLPYAYWYVRVELDGYKEQELTHDPFTEANHLLHFHMHKK